MVGEFVLNELILRVVVSGVDVERARPANVFQKRVDDVGGGRGKVAVIDHVDMVTRAGHDGAAAVKNQGASRLPVLPGHGTGVEGLPLGDGVRALARPQASGDGGNENQAQPDPFHLLDPPHTEPSQPVDRLSQPYKDPQGWPTNKRIRYAGRPVIANVLGSEGGLVGWATGVG